MHTPGSRVHLTIAIDESKVEQVAELRRKFDPAMAAGVSPHITVAYPEEFDDRELLIERAREVARSMAPFTMASTEVATDSDDGTKGVFLALSDPTGSWHELRGRLLAPPFAQLDVPPHLTIVHPRTSDRGREAWTELKDHTLSMQVIVSTLSLTTTSEINERSTTEVVPLTDTGRAIVASVLPLAEDKLLLGHRDPRRRSYPNVWDVIGGHIEAGETPAGAACREANEELGVRVSPPDLRYLTTLVDEDFELVMFTARTWAGTPVNNAPEEHTKIEWFAEHQLGELNLAHPLLVEPMKEALRQRHGGSDDAC